MDDVEGDFGIGVVPIDVFDGGGWADEEVAKQSILPLFFIDGEGDAIGGCGVIKVVAMELADLLFVYEENGELICFDSLECEEGLHHLLYGESIDWKI